LPEYSSKPRAEVKSVLVVAPYAAWAPHWETDLELAQRYLDAGDRVTIATCERRLGVCDPNPDHTWSGCLACTGRLRSGLALLEGDFTVEPLPFDDQPRRAAAVPKSIGELVSMKVGNFDLGWAVLSSLVSWHADPDPDLGDPRVAHHLREMMHESLRVYQGMRARLGSGDIDLVVVFNGRFAITRAVIRACEAAKVEYVTHDRGRDHDHFELHGNRLPHDRVAMLGEIHRVWDQREEPERTRIARSFFEERRAGLLRSWRSYVGGQVPGRLPEGWDAERRNVVVFASSEDEMVGIGDDWKNQLYDSQVEGIRDIAARATAERNVELWVRMHPNQAGNRAPSVRELKEMHGPRLHIIGPESRCSTYAMLDAADAVVTFGSTIGIEAAYWGKPSILVGVAAYSTLGSVYEPRSTDDLIAILAREQIAPLPDKGALMYGLYEQTRGEPFSYFRSTGLFEGTFKGRHIRPGIVYRMLAPVGRRVRKFWRMLRDRTR
jgi:hypothetical protein